MLISAIKSITIKIYRQEQSILVQVQKNTDKKVKVECKHNIMQNLQTKFYFTI